MVEQEDDDDGIEELPEYLKNTAAARHWSATTAGCKTFGVCVPLFSLRSDRQAGMGDFGDLYNMIDFCAGAGMGLLQLLPINDSGWDGVPYSAMSAFALDPAFIALDRIEGLGRDWRDHVKAISARYRDAERLNNPEVRHMKLRLLQQAWDRVRTPEMTGLIEQFAAENDWVATYAAFKVVKAREGLLPWEAWSTVRGMTPAQVVQSVRRLPEFQFHLFCQWLADQQMADVHDYATSRGVLLEGDIPILVARDSADVWARPDMFHLEYAAGAPPDMYSEDGQHWGFPTYNWDVIETDNYAWWRKRLAAASRYFDCYRIDHVVGFFRIWTIEVQKPNGREGWFVPRDEALWGEHGRKILQMMLDSTDMLPLAEDLGTIPDICRSTLLDMGICGLKVQRWEKRWNTDRKFIPPEDYQPVSVATLSTHDCELAADWWRQAGAEERQELWELMGGQFEALDVMTPELAAELVKWFSTCRSRFIVHSLGDLLYPLGFLRGDLADHRVNVPGVVGPQNWSWRVPMDIRRVPLASVKALLYP